MKLDLPRPSSRDVAAGVAVALLAIPQGLAYAVIAGLPPVMGLYAAGLPVIVGSLVRSSRVAVIGPTNAVSLLVGGAMGLLATQAEMSPLEVGVTLALLVGVLQAGLGLLRLGALVDWISQPVVLGYITGAGVLIGVGQLPTLTHTPGERGSLPWQLWSWAQGLAGTHVPSLLTGLAVIALLLVMKMTVPSWPRALVVLVLAIAGSLVFDLRGLGVEVVADLEPIPAGLPALSLPHLDHLSLFLPVAVATAVLSLVESTAVARSLAMTEHTPLDPSREFLGQGVANIVAAFSGAYPTSGSLSRSALNHALGATSRWGGVVSGVVVLGLVALVAPLIDLTPLPALAGLLVILAIELVDGERVRRVWRTSLSDRAALAATVLGTWSLPLDQAIYLGVAISVGMFLRRVRMLRVTEMAWDTRPDRPRALREVYPGDPEGTWERIPGVRVLHVEGALFFGSAGELQVALDEVLADPAVRVLVLRLKRAQGMDSTVADVLARKARSLETQGRHLVLVGMREDTVEVLRRSGALASLGSDHLFPTQRQWFAAMEDALELARALAEDGRRT